MNNYIVPAQWNKHKYTILAWPNNKKIWLEDLSIVQKEFVNFCCSLINANEQLKILVTNNQTLDEAIKKISNTKVEYLKIPYGDIWLRDTGPIFAKNLNNKFVANIFQFNGWGNKYVFKHDNKVATNIANKFKLNILNYNYILEGGSIESNGLNTCLTTKQCLLNKNRNKELSQNDIEKNLKNMLGFEKILWLEEGLLNDHTNGHIDTLARFVSYSKVVCMRAHYKNDPNFKILKQNSIQLKKFTNASGNRLEVIEIPSPGIIKNNNGKIMPASFVNFYNANNAIIMPSFNSHFDEEAMEILSKSLNKKIITKSAKAILTGGGTFNCITLEVPIGV